MPATEDRGGGHESDKPPHSAGRTILSPLLLSRVLVAAGGETHLTEGFVSVQVPWATTGDQHNSQGFHMVQELALLFLPGQEGGACITASRGNLGKPRVSLGRKDSHLCLQALPYAISEKCLKELLLPEDFSLESAIQETKANLNPAYTRLQMENHRKQKHRRPTEHLIQPLVQPRSS